MDDGAGSMPRSVLKYSLGNRKPKHGIGAETMYRKTVRVVVTAIAGGDGPKFAEIVSVKVVPSGVVGST